MGAAASAGASTMANRVVVVSFATIFVLPGGASRSRRRLPLRFAVELGSTGDTVPQAVAPRATGRVTVAA